MLNQEIYQKDPSQRKLVNEGVASVNDDKSQQALSVLRYELETFVCNGQYEKGVAHILDTYLRNIDQAQQPAVWVSGFFGSGKSHLVKMLRNLWVDTDFPDGATARGLANLPQGVQDQLLELNTQAKRHGGLFAAAGTLGASARDKSVRLALLSIIFRAAGLPEQYPQARFVMWLREEGIEDAVRAEVEAAGYDWQEEIDNLYVAEGLHEALCKVKSKLFASPDACAEVLVNLHPNVQDVSSDEMLKSIRMAVSKEGKFPLTLIVLDEVQQYIGESGQRSIDVQEAVEACCKGIGGKLMFVGTGQTAVTGTSNLKRLEGRFTVRIELSDADVDGVIRQVILAKKSGVSGQIESLMQTNLGEISRHLNGSQLAHRQDDIQYFAQDYPILPVRRRFWEAAQRVLDQTGTDSQLRNQLSMIHKAIQTNLSCPMGHVIPADYLYFDAIDKLLQARVLPRKVHDKTLQWRNGGDSEQLLARACGLVFLINKIAAADPEMGLHANVDTVADLLVEDLSAGSSKLRSALPDLMDRCDLLMKVGDEYRIQTEESTAWMDEFRAQQSSLANEAYRIESERDDRIRRRFAELVRKLSLTQGVSKVARDIHPLFDAQLPNDANKRIYVWVRDGWSCDENTVQIDARQAGNSAPTVYVYIPKRSADDLLHHLRDYKAAAATLDKRGTPNSPEGIEARAAMETTRHNADARIKELLSDAFQGARVFQAGGTELLGNDLQDLIFEGAENALSRLYPQFSLADNTGWGKAYDKARNGAPDALKAVGYDGEVQSHPVCKTVMAWIGGGKKGADLRDQFEGSPYGWSRDAVNGALQTLLVAGLLRAHGENGQPVDPRALENKAIGKTLFKLESATVTAPQRIQIRKLLQKLEVSCKQGEELSVVPVFLEKLRALASQAGGDAPRPVVPDAAFIDEIRLSAGNEQLLALFNRREEITQCIESWGAQATKVAERLPQWQQLSSLIHHTNGLQDADILRAQVNSIEQHRELLQDPNPIDPLVSHLTQLLREELGKLDSEYSEGHKAGMERLHQDNSWQQLEPEQRNTLLSEQRLTLADQPQIQVGNTEEVVATLTQISLSMFSDRVAAMPGRFDAVLTRAAELCEPQASFVKVPTRMLKTEAEVDEWLNEVADQIKTALNSGPVQVR